MIAVFRKLYFALEPRERGQAVLVFVFMLASAVIEVAGVASIMPFVAVLANPDIIGSNEALAWLYAAGGFEDHSSFLVFLGVAVLIVLVGSLALKAVGVWLQLRFSLMREHFWGRKLIHAYLHQPYEWFLTRQSSNLANSILNEVSQVVTGVLIPSLQLLAQAVVVLLLLGLLLAVDPLLAISMGVLLGSLYGLMFIALKKPLIRNGEERRERTRQRFAIVQEAFSGIKDVKVAGTEMSFINRFEIPSKRLATVKVWAGIVNQIPSFFMQALLFGGMIAALLYLMTSYGGFQEALPIVALYAFAGYRLMPALQGVYQQASQMKFVEPSLNSMSRDLEDYVPKVAMSLQQQGSDLNAERMHLSHSIQLVDVTYKYPEAANPALLNVSLEIPALRTIGFVGATGSGKTTSVDIMLGLLPPTHGELRVDGTPIDPANLRRWRRCIGYVPQSIFLADDSVAANIAFGIPPELIDRAAVEKAAQIANLHDFIVNELPQGYNTSVGERGIRLSGGQRQRIGIARALYHDPDVLIMDEATSALDNLTELAVMDAVRRLARKKTIILIAHRLSTVRQADQIIFMGGGRVLCTGTFDELLSTNAEFRRLAEAA